MDNKVAKLISLIHKLPESCLDDALDFISEKIEKTDKDADCGEPSCPHCKSDTVRRNGRKNGKQRFICVTCKKTFGITTSTALSSSHFGEAIWKQVIRDTINGVPLNKTAKSIEVAESTAFNMRHKILLSLEAENARTPAVLGVVCELDDTFVLESYKGTKLPCDFWRKPRKHGAVAQKRGISNEYVCISTGVSRNGGVIAKSVTRATPSKDDINAVFGGHIEPETLIMCDGAKGYNDFGESHNCDIVVVKERKGFAHTNTASSLHSLIKERYNKYRGVATKYLNRYNALFAKLFRNQADLADEIYNIMASNNTPRHHSVADVKGLGLLGI
jgi:transposase-like protein/uncharacterized protein YdcH (DUF465 family)